jgi:hypothetical protein
MTDLALQMEAPRSLALREHRNLRFVTLFLLYFAQGLPFGLIDFALPYGFAPLRLQPRSSPYSWRS